MENHFIKNTKITMKSSLHLYKLNEETLSSNKEIVQITDFENIIYTGNISFMKRCEHIKKKKTFFTGSY